MLKLVGAGGVSVIAHPLSYKLTATKLRNLINEFKVLGGKAIEVVTGHSQSAEIELATDYAKRFGMAASVGSDFHNENTRLESIRQTRRITTRTYACVGVMVEIKYHK